METAPAARVLIADDDADLCAFVASVFASTCDVESVVSAEAALERIAAAPPFDVIISDYRLPGRDGLSFIKTIRANADDRIAVTPIVMISGTADPALDASARSAGADRFLDKPFTLQQIRRAVGALLAPRTACGQT